MPLPRVDNESLFQRLAMRLGATLVWDCGPYGTVMRLNLPAPAAASDDPK